MPAMLIGTIDLYHFNMPISVTLTLAGCHEVRVKKGLPALHTFQLIRMKFDVLKQFRQNSLIQRLK